jgi:lipopolysaccharide/colanic/teichoic acid biosynthesis glycosyltransferase
MANCKECKEKRMEVNTPENVPYIVHETAMARNERNVKRMVVALVAAIALIFASNALWLWAWMQYDYSGEEIIVEQDTTDGGNANYIGNDGDIVNGLPEGDY